MSLAGSLRRVVPGLRRSADDLSGAVDDAASGGDDAADDAASAGNSADVDGNADDGFYQGMRPGQRIVHDLGARTVEQPARAVGGITGGLASATKYGVGGVAAAYTGGKVIDYAAMNSRQDAYEALQQRLTAIENNDNLSPEEKQQAKQDARERFQQAFPDGGGEPSSASGLLSGLSFLDGAGQGSGVFGGVLGKLLLGMAIISTIWAAPRAIDAINGGS